MKKQKVRSKIRKSAKYQNQKTMNSAEDYELGFASNKLKQMSFLDQFSLSNYLFTIVKSIAGVGICNLEI